jgi:hypothetical protein
MKTTHEIKMMFGKGPLQTEITIPAGTRVSPASHGQYFVEDLSWLDKNSMTYHDANYYGIRLNADQLARPVEAYDLELYAINTGQFYQWHTANAGEPLGVWLQHVATTVKPRYCREVEPVSATPETLQTVAAALKAYYEQHNRESAQ